MILLRPDCLVFETSGGENIPCSVTEVTIELLHGAGEWLDQEIVENAAAAVLHYFRVEQERVSVSVAEFSEALENVLRGLGLNVKAVRNPSAPEASLSDRCVVEADLNALAGDSGGGGELFFFPRLRDEVRRQLAGSPRLLRFRGLRNCVKHLTGARRWTAQCRALNDQIVDYLRTCLTREPAGAGSAMVVLSEGESPNAKAA